MEGSKIAKFETLCGRTFDSSAALASFLGVTKGAISHAKSDAKERGRAFFECGKPTKRFIRILETDESTQQLSEGDDTNCRFLHTDVLGNKMKRLHAQGYMQAAALKLFPNRNLRLTPAANTSEEISIAVLRTEAASYTMFDVAEMWMFYSPVSAPSISAFRKVLHSGSKEIMAYSSLMFAEFPQEECRLRPYMLAEDILRFLLSSFARKLQHNPLFDDEAEEAGKQQAPSVAQASPPPALPPPALPPPALPPPALPPPALPPQEECKHGQLPPPSYAECMRLGTSPEDEYMHTCSDIILDIKLAMQQRCEMLREPGDCERIKRRRLAASAVHNVTTMLFAANKLLYAEARGP